MLVSVSVLWLAIFIHPLHVSVTEIEMDEKDKRLEIMMRIFVDDLETTLRHSLNQPELDILNPKPQTLDQMMEGYLRSHFKMALDGKPQTFRYLGHEQENEAFIFYVEVEKIRKWKTIQVQNDIITEVYEDQSNLVHVSVGETVRSMRLTRSHPVDKLSFDIK
jgi:hypothetical protein